MFSQRVIATEHTESGRTVLFRSLFERSGIRMAALDPGYRVLEANADLLSLLNRSAEDVGGREFTELLHPALRDRLRNKFAKLVEGKRGRFTEHVAVLRPDGAAIAGDLTAVVVPDNNPATTSFLVLIRTSTAEDGGQAVVDQRKVLTAVDARILEGIAAGVPTVRMAAQLYLSRQGVEYHVSVMFRKLKAPNRSALVSRAYALGMLSVASWPPRVLPQYVK
jgi:PAS domain S-box-containing protein